MVNFHSYVSAPEGTGCIWLIVWKLFSLISGNLGLKIFQRVETTNQVTTTDGLLSTCRKPIVSVQGSCLTIWVSYNDLIATHGATANDGWEMKNYFPSGRSFRPGESFPFIHILWYTKVLAHIYDTYMLYYIL